MPIAKSQTPQDRLLDRNSRNFVVEFWTSMLSLLCECDQSDHDGSPPLDRTYATRSSLLCDVLTVQHSKLWFWVGKARIDPIIYDQKGQRSTKQLHRQSAFRWIAWNSEQYSLQQLLQLKLNLQSGFAVLATARHPVASGLSELSERVWKCFHVAIDGRGRFIDEIKFSLLSWT